MLNSIVEALKRKNYRITESRRKLINLFVNNPEKHITMNELQELMPDENTASLYNNISFLLTENIINEVFLDRKKYYQLNYISHGHFVCEECGTFFNVDIDDFIIKDEDILKKYGFHIKQTNIELFGLCKKCKEVSKEQLLLNIVNNDELCLNDLEIEKYVLFLNRHFKNTDMALSVVFLSSKDIKKINNEFRGIDKETDVLSFPGDKDYLGDIIICMDVLRKNAKKYNFNEKKELLFLVTHGYLHILGFDHQNSVGEKEMFTKQEELLNEYGVRR
ncbi:MAG: rRNA maturation RNase YbeY [Mycoplasmatales bacterium]